MPRINLIVEGQSEETFVRDVLGPYLGERSVFIKARSLETGRSRGVIYRGGVTNYLKAQRDIQTWLLADKNAYVTTMLDLYALPESFPGFEERNDLTGIRRALFLEKKFGERIDQERFIPYIQVHEFEALVFACTESIHETIGGPDKRRKLSAIRATYPCPEDINDSPTTAPSKRLLDLYPSYKKVLHGSRITARAGLIRIREECPHFHEWLEQLENLPEIT